MEWKKIKRNKQAAIRHFVLRYVDYELQKNCFFWSTFHIYTFPLHQKKEKKNKSPLKKMKWSKKFLNQKPATRRLNWKLWKKIKHFFYISLLLFLKCTIHSSGIIIISSRGNITSSFHFISKMKRNNGHNYNF